MKLMWKKKEEEGGRRREDVRCKKTGVELLLRCYPVFGDGVDRRTVSDDIIPVF